MYQERVLPFTSGEVNFKKNIPVLGSLVSHVKSNVLWEEDAFSFPLPLSFHSWSQLTAYCEFFRPLCVVSGSM